MVKYTGTASAVSIPTSVKHIGKEAFAGHTELVKVEVPGYIESIDYNAFSGCSSLETIAIPDTVTSIGNGAFSGCSSLRNMKLGKNLKKLGSGAARDILSLNLSPAVEVDNKITASKDGHLGFGGLNPWQPLGKVAYEGETIIVYVGHNTKRVGENTNLRLIATQHHAESNCPLDGANLKVGRNELTFRRRVTFQHLMWRDSS